jgi:hypothetical protein
VLSSWSSCPAASAAGTKHHTMLAKTNGATVPIFSQMPDD